MLYSPRIRCSFHISIIYCLNKTNLISIIHVSSACLHTRCDNLLIKLNNNQFGWFALCEFIVSYQNAGLNYATAQKLVAVPTYTQATYRPVVPPTAATAATAYTNAYAQPTGIAPVKVRSRFSMKNFPTFFFLVFGFQIHFTLNFGFYLVHSRTTDQLLQSGCSSLPEICIRPINKCDIINTIRFIISTKC